MKVTITLTEAHAGVLIDALDLYMRVMIGQLENVEEVLRFTYPIANEKLRFARQRLDELKAHIWGFEPGGSFGIHNPVVHDHARKAADIKHVIRHAIAKKKNPTGSGVDFYEPRQISLEPLPTIKLEP